MMRTAAPIATRGSLTIARCWPAIAIVVFALASCSRPADVAAPDLTGDVVTQTPVASQVWDVRDAGLRAVWSADLPALADALFVGDLIGDGAPEIVVGTASELRLYSTEGGELTSHGIPAPTATYGLLADVDGDRKADVIFGSQRDSLSRVRAMNGQGEIIFEAAAGTLVEGITVPQFVADGMIYFTAGSRMRITPRVTGSVDTRSGDLTWLRTDGVVPTGLVHSAVAETIGIHTTGVSRDLPEANAELDTNPARSAVLVVDSDGGELLFSGLGEPLIEGIGGDDQVTAVRTYPVMIDGESRVLVAEDHASTLHGGNAAVLLLDYDGNVLARHEGPPACEARVGVQTNSDGELENVAVVWSSTGVLELLDADFSVRVRSELPGTVHHADLALIANLDGRGGAEYVIRDLDGLYLVGDDGAVRASGRFAGQIVSVRVLEAPESDADEAASLVVLANDLHLVRPVAGGGTPADGQAAIGGEAQRRAVTPGGASWAPITIESSHASGAFEVLAEATLPDGATVWALEDVTDDGVPDAILYSAAESAFGLLDERLSLASHAGIPERVSRSRVLCSAQTGGPGLIANVRTAEMGAALAVGFDGSVGYRTPLTPCHGAVLTLLPPTVGILPVAINSGHPLWPRGEFALDAATGMLRFFYPTAGFAQYAAVANGIMFVGNYTPNNGHERVLDDGRIDRDGAMFLHAVSLDGVRMSWARPFPVEPTRGTVAFTTLDADGDGNEEVYASIRRDPNYNLGVPGVYAVGSDGSIDLLYEGPENDAANPVVVRATDGDRLVLRWRWVEPEFVTVLGGSSLSEASEYSDPRKTYEAFVNLDTDDAVEQVFVEDGAAVITELGGDERTEIRWADHPVSTYRSGQDSVSGAWYLLVAGTERIALLRLSGPDAR